MHANDSTLYHHNIIAGSAAPVVFVAGVSIAARGLATATTWNEEQKQIEDLYTPLVKKYKEILNRSKMPIARAEKELQELEDIINDSMSIQKQFKSRNVS